MKLNITKALLAIVLGLSLTLSYQSEAKMVKTTKGYRLDTTKWTTTPLKDIEDFKSLKKGDKIAVYCPMKKRYMVTRIYNVDSKGRVKFKKNSSGWEMDDCGVVLKRKPGKKEVEPMIVCPDGSLNPTICKKLVPVKKPKN